MSNNWSDTTQPSRKQTAPSPTLYQLTADEAGPRRLLNELKPLIEKRRALFQKSIELAQQAAGEKEKQAVARDGARLQDRLRKSLEKLEDIENKMLNPQWAREKRKTRIILWVLTGGAFASFSLLVLLFYRLNQEIGVRKRAESQVAAYQDNLRSLASSLSLAEERERRRLAVYLHDQIGHTLALANIKLGELQKSLSGQCPGFPTDGTGKNRQPPGAGHPGHPFVDFQDQLPHTL